MSSTPPRDVNIARSFPDSFSELLHGKGAHVDPEACVEDLSGEQAVRRMEGMPHSVAELVFHMNYWMDYELRRIRGHDPKYPEHNSESFPAHTTATSDEWMRLRKQFGTLLSEYAALGNSSAQELQRQIPSAHFRAQRVDTVQEILWQMLIHNSYHIGQIALIRRGLGIWPPPGGGDSW